VNTKRVVSPPASWQLQLPAFLFHSVLLLCLDDNSILNDVIRSGQTYSKPKNSVMPNVSKSKETVVFRVDPNAALWKRGRGGGGKFPKDNFVTCNAVGARGPNGINVDGPAHGNKGDDKKHYTSYGARQRKRRPFAKATDVVSSIQSRRQRKSLTAAGRVP